MSLTTVPLPAEGHSTPLIHRFRTEEHCYVYDANTNRVVRVDDALYALIESMMESGRTMWTREQLLHRFPGRGAEWADRAVDGYSRARKAGLFSRHKAGRVAGQDLESAYQTQYATQLQQLTLEVTEGCNLRCKYCTYSGNYKLQRTYSDARMPVHSAKKAIDYFLAHSVDTDIPAITFYGGEPLLGMSIISECCRWASRQTRRKIRFQLTTNGTLLTARMVERLMDLDIYVVVSIDGPENSHDANRLTIGGEGSWRAILNNLRKIRSKYPDYYRSHLGVNCVIAPNSSPARTAQFFESEDDLFGSGVLLVAMVSDKRTDYWKVNPPTTSWYSELISLRSRYYESIITGQNRSRFLDAMFQSDFLKLQRREISTHLPHTLPLNGSCLPGVRRLFVDCAGNYHMCERIHRAFPIGHVDSGLDLKAIEAVCKKYQDVANAHCRDCWLVRFCPKCFASADLDSCEGFAADCEVLRAGFSASLSDYCRIAEINPFAFRFMEEIIVS